MQQVLHVKWVRISTCVSLSSKLSCVVTGGGNSIDQTEKRNIRRRGPHCWREKEEAGHCRTPIERAEWVGGGKRLTDPLWENDPKHISILRPVVFRTEREKELSWKCIFDGLPKRKLPSFFFLPLHNGRRHFEKPSSCDFPPFYSFLFLKKKKLHRSPPFPSFCQLRTALETRRGKRGGTDRRVTITGFYFF